MLLRPKIVVQHGMGHTSRFRYRNRSRAGKALGQKFPFCSLENRFFLTNLRIIR